MLSFVFADKARSNIRAPLGKAQILDSDGSDGGVGVTRRPPSRRRANSSTVNWSTGLSNM
jgi:hypothetical protein